MISLRNISLALQDIAAGWQRRSAWLTLGWQDVRVRYRRSFLGPLWISLSLAITVGAITIVYGQIFNQDWRTYLPYLATGMVAWHLISSLITEGCQCFIQSEGLIKQIKLPLTIHVLRTVWRNIVIFGHNMIIVLPILFFTGHANWLAPLWSFLSIGLFILNGWAIGIIFGMLSARFRDVPQLVGNLLQVVFFVTPVFWRPEALGHRAYLAEWNPIYHFVELWRAPWMNAPVPTFTLLFCLVTTLLVCLGAFLIFAHRRQRIAYWM